MRNALGAALCSAAAALAACSRQTESVTPTSAAHASSSVPAPAPTMPLALPALMQQVFGTRYDAQQDRALVEQSNPDQGNVRTTFLVRGEDWKDMQDGRVLVVAVAVPLESQSVPEDFQVAEELAHGVSYLNVYLLQRNGAEWQVTRREEGAFRISGRLDLAAWVDLGFGRPGLAIRTQVFGQGVLETHLDILDVSGESAHQLTDSIAIEQETSACGEDGCSVSASESWQPPRDKNHYPGLVLAFKGTLPSRMPEPDSASEVDAVGAGGSGADALPAVPAARAVNATAVYRFDGKRYILVRGTNPVVDDR